ncbi:helix-turn-helix domain-containing protein [Halomarina litorea]|uniref:helix-turn-helix domain-containing protein n=1 Tax=Halomarina litorea TaxID=2961595 RepID=UPI0020C596F3|nr:helix-turn-helix domain-containing protein [Halomarina sp. BCD28]
MSVIAEFSIDSAEFVLGEVLATDPEVRIELERVVPASRRVMPFFWAVGEGRKTFEREVRNSEYVRSLVPLDELTRQTLYKIEWSEEVESLIYGIAEVGATILEAQGDGDWFFRIRFDDHSGLAAFHNYCQRHDISFTLERVYTLEARDSAGFQFDLTDEQREAVVRAVEGGYFDVPRGVTLDDLAAGLGISRQAVSERIRRGVGKVLSSVAL